MVKFVFSEPQKRLTVSAIGKVLLLLNEKKKENEVAAEVTTDGSETTTEMRVAVSYEYDGVWLDTGGLTSEQALAAAAQKQVLGKIEEYDKSEAVNAFLLDGRSVWIDKDTRMGLRQNIADKKALGEECITMWMLGTPITLPCDKAEELMCGLENYAYECFNVTAEHKAEVNAMSDVESVLGYDYTKGYPEKINIKLK